MSAQNSTRSEQLLRTPLYEEHVKLKAKMVPFGGWEMPVQYEGILAEHHATRNGATLFDICHMGEFIVEGDVKETGLDRLVTMPLADLPVKTSRYGAILNEQGGVIDDCIIFRMEEKKWFVVVNGSTIKKDATHFLKNLRKPEKFLDVSAQLGKLDLQGPLSRDVLKRFVPSLDRLQYFTFDFFELLGEKNILISRTGYTGELGYEIFYPWNKTVDLWRALLGDERVKPAGLGARDVLRLEKGYSLYGHELNDETTPLESGLERFIDFSKDFIGRDVLLKQKEKGIPRKLVGILSDNRRAPREGQEIFSSEGKLIGKVSSGTFSPCLNVGIALGFVSTEAARLNQKIAFGSSTQQNPATLTGKIFYKQGSIKA